MPSIIRASLPGLSMKTAIKAGIAYFLLVFAIGFVLGTIRVLFLLQRIGELGAVVLELPVMLAASWMICRWLIRRLRVPGDVPSRLTMGACAFALLMVAELGLSVMVFGNSLSSHLQHFATDPGAIGLAGQIAFGLFPLLQRQ